jgi:serine/threonine protein kinase
MMRPPNPLVVRTRSGNREYRIARTRLGGGSFGTVYRGQDEFGTDFAIKIILVPDEPHKRSEVERRFEREAQALAGIRHPHVVGYGCHGLTHGVEVDGEEHDGYVLVTEYVDGPPLLELIGPTGISPGSLREVVSQACSGLQAVHDPPVSLIHRDIKPENLVISAAGGRLKIVDFGLGCDPVSSPPAADSTAVGTPWYMAPEQLHGDFELTPATDQYALSVLVYELLSGQSPFGSDVYISMQRRREGSAPNSLAPCGLGSFDRFFRKGLAHQQEDRFRNVRAWYEAFESLAEQAGFERKKLTIRRPPACASSDSSAGKTTGNSS